MSDFIEIVPTNDKCRQLCRVLINKNNILSITEKRLYGQVEIIMTDGAVHIVNHSFDSFKLEFDANLPTSDNHIGWVSIDDAIGMDDAVKKELLSININDVDDLIVCDEKDLLVRGINADMIRHLTSVWLPSMGLKLWHR